MSLWQKFRLEQNVEATLPKKNPIFGRIAPLSTFPCSTHDHACIRTIALYTIDAPPNANILKTYGIARGTASLNNNALSQALQTAQSIMGTETGGVTKNLQKSYEMAELRMVDAAREIVESHALEHGEHVAIVGVRSESGATFGSIPLIYTAVYGTVVLLDKTS